MTASTTDYVNVITRSNDLGCLYPQRGLALLPVNFESASSIGDLLQTSETATIKKLFLAEGIPVGDIVDRNQRPPYIKNKHYEWVAPTLFVTAALYSQNPAIVSVALGVLANYATDFFKGKSGAHEVNLDIVLEKKKYESYLRVSYRDPIAGLSELPDAIREVNK